MSILTSYFFEKRQSPEKVSIIFFWRLQKCFSISTSLLSDKFDRIQLEFVGIRKVVFVLLRFLGEEISNPLVDWQLSSSFYRTGRAAAVVDYSRWCLASILIHSQAIRLASNMSAKHFCTFSSNTKEQDCLYNDICHTVHSCDVLMCVIGLCLILMCWVERWRTLFWANLARCSQ